MRCSHAASCGRSSVRSPNTALVRRFEGHRKDQVCRLAFEHHRGYALVASSTQGTVVWPEDQRSAFADREIAFLKSTGKFPDNGFLDRLEGYPDQAGPSPGLRWRFDRRICLRSARPN
jgi:hypothetical protein